jgi:hypothetical protein
MKKYKYMLRVKAYYLYEIEANSEREAKDILEKDNSIDVSKIIIENYDKAHCLSKEKNK